MRFRSVGHSRLRTTIPTDGGQQAYEQLRTHSGRSRTSRWPGDDGNLAPDRRNEADIGTRGIRPSPNKGAARPAKQTLTRLPSGRSPSGRRSPRKHRPPGHREAARWSQMRLDLEKGRLRRSPGRKGGSGACISVTVYEVLTCPVVTRGGGPVILSSLTEPKPRSMIHVERGFSHRDLENLL